MHNHYEQARQVNVKINKYHQDPIRARQLQLARAGRPDPVSNLMISLRSTLAAMVGTVHASFRRIPAASPEPVAEPSPNPVQGMVGKPEEATAIV